MSRLVVSDEDANLEKIHWRSIFGKLLIRNQIFEKFLRLKNIVFKKDNYLFRKLKVQ